MSSLSLWVIVWALQSHLWMGFTQPLEEADPQAALLCSPGGNQGG
jgi:hypothetical protein